MEENKEIGQNLIYNKRQNLSEENQTNWPETLKIQYILQLFKRTNWKTNESGIFNWY